MPKPPTSFRAVSKMAYHRAVQELIERNKGEFIARWAALRAEIATKFKIKPSDRVRKKKPSKASLRLLALNSPAPKPKMGPVWPSQIAPEAKKEA